MTVNIQTANPPPERFNFAQHLLAKNYPHPQRIAYIDDNCSLTYGQLDERIRCTAAALLALGLQPGERILLVMHDTVDLPVAFRGAVCGHRSGADQHFASSLRLCVPDRT